MATAGAITLRRLVFLSVFHMGVSNKRRRRKSTSPSGPVIAISSIILFASRPIWTNRTAAASGFAVYMSVLIARYAIPRHGWVEAMGPIILHLTPWEGGSDWCVGKVLALFYVLCWRSLPSFA